MDPRFQPQQAMFYETSLQEANHEGFFTTTNACLAIQQAQIDLDIYEAELIDTGIVGMLNSIFWIDMGFALVTGFFAGTVGLPAAVVGVGLISLGVVDYQVYLAHFGSGGNFFHSRKEMQEYEDLLSWNPTVTEQKWLKWVAEDKWEDALKTIIDKFGKSPPYPKLPDRDEVGLARDTFASFSLSLECRTSHLETHLGSLGKQGSPAANPAPHVTNQEGSQSERLPRLNSSPRLDPSPVKQKFHFNFNMSPIDRGGAAGNPDGDGAAGNPDGDGAAGNPDGDGVAGNPDENQ